MLGDRTANRLFFVLAFSLTVEEAVHAFFE